MPTHDDLFTQLLSNPPGRYGLSTFGRTHAVILTGDPAFRDQAYSLFTNGGGEAKREIDEMLAEENQIEEKDREGIEVRHKTPLPRIHKADRPNTVWFCMPERRVELALALWFWGQLYSHHARDVVDEEGDFVEVVCDHEDTLWSECQQLACDFVVSHMRPDSGVLPSYEEDPYAPTEHSIGQTGAAHTSEDA